MSIKCAILLAICLLATLVGISDGIKCYDGQGKTSGSEASVYKEVECVSEANACLTVDCAGVHDGSTMKVCSIVPANVDMNKYKCNVVTSWCNITGVRSDGKYCRFCQGDLCNSDHIVTTTTASTTTTTTRRTTTTMTTTTTRPKTTTTTTKRPKTTSRATTINDMENGLTFHHPAAFSLLFGIGVVIVAVGHFLL